MVIPAQLRDQLGLELGTSFYIKIENEKLVLEDSRQRWKAVKQKLQGVRRRAAGRLLSEELIEDRRKEAKRDALA